MKEHNASVIVMIVIVKMISSSLLEFLVPACADIGAHK